MSTDALRAEVKRWELSDAVRDRRVSVTVVLEVAEALGIPAKKVRKHTPGRYAAAQPGDKVVEFRTRKDRRDVESVFFNAGWHNAPYPECDNIGKRRPDGTSNDIVLIDAETAPTPEEMAARVARYAPGGAAVVAPQECQTTVWSHGGACARPATGTRVDADGDQVPACDQHAYPQGEPAGGEGNGEGLMCDHLDAHRPVYGTEFAACAKCSARWRRELCACEHCFQVPVPAAVHDVPEDIAGDIARDIRGDIAGDDVEEHPFGASHDDDQDEDEPERVDPDDPTSMIRPKPGDTVLLHDGTRARVLGLQAAVDHSFAVDRYHVLAGGRRRVVPVDEIAGYPELEPEPRGEPADIAEEDGVHRDMPERVDAGKNREYSCTEPGCSFHIVAVDGDDPDEFDEQIERHDQWWHEPDLHPDGTPGPVPAIVQLDRDEEQAAALDRVLDWLTDGDDTGTGIYEPEYVEAAAAAAVLPVRSGAGAR